MDVDNDIWLALREAWNRLPIGEKITSRQLMETSFVLYEDLTPSQKHLFYYFLDRGIGKKYLKKVATNIDTGRNKSLCVYEKLRNIRVEERQFKPRVKKEEVMKNVQTEVKGTNLVITVDLTKTFGPSKSGKTIIIASTEGNKQVAQNGVTLGLNVYK